MAHLVVRVLQRAWLLAVLLYACKPAAPDLESLESASSDLESWVTVHDPQRASPGYTLVFYANRIPILLDMNGRIVHRWPEARVKSRLRLNPDGSILAIALGRGVVEYNWQGEKTWGFESELGFAHHDVIRLSNGNTITLIRPDEGQFDIVLEVDRAGQVVWQWDAEDHLRPFVPPKSWSKVDVTHLNSVQSLPENPWFEGGDPRFRPGNLLLSARDMNLVFIVDKQTQEVVWTFETGLDKQHEPLMIGPGYPRAGNILIFNNRYRSFYTDRHSTVFEVNPSSQQIVWQFRTAGFYTPTSGVLQPLPSGNILITSSRGGRVFETTRGGKVVWEWVPPFDPTRAHRYSPRHTPQMAALKEIDRHPVRPEPGYRYIDTDVYRFARRGLRQEIRVAGKKVSVLKYNNDCRSLVLPSGARAEVTYGLHAERIAGQGRDSYSAKFSLAVRPPGSGEILQLLEETLDLADSTWRTRSVDLRPYSLKPIDLCITTEEVGAPEGTPTEELALWQQPLIESDTIRGAITENELEPLTDEELEARKKHLEALGYIN